MLEDSAMRDDNAKVSISTQTQKIQKQPEENDNEASHTSDQSDFEKEKGYAKSFVGIPDDWHETIQVKNKQTQRVKLFFKCKHKGCNSIFKKSCNLRDHFRKHTGQRPFECP